MNYITCNICNASYNKNNEFVHFLSNTHLKYLNQYYCQQCKLKMNLSERENHLNSDFHKSKKVTYFCEDCNSEIALNTKSKHFKSEKHKQSILAREQGLRDNSKSRAIVHENVVNNFQNSSEYNKLVDQQYSIKFPHSIDISEKQQNIEVNQTIQQFLNQVPFFKYKYDIQYFSQYHSPSEDIIPVWFSSKIYHSHEFPDVNELKNLIEEYEGNGSGLVNGGIQKMIINTYKTHDIQASSYIPLPKKYHDSKSIINIKNEDNYCFIYSVLAYFIKPEYHRERPSWYTPHFNK